MDDEGWGEREKKKESNSAEADEMEKNGGWQARIERIINSGYFCRFLHRKGLRASFMEDNLSLLDKSNVSGSVGRGGDNEEDAMTRPPGNSCVLLVSSRRRIALVPRRALRIFRINGNLFLV